MKRMLLLPLLLLAVGSGVLRAQEGVIPTKKAEITDADFIKFFRGFTIGGTVQAQWQLGQEKGMNGGPSSGGAFSENSDNRFMLRRGYLKVGYGSTYFSSLIQINATAEGISLVNAYAEINTASKSVAFRVGSIYKPFGYFVYYPSASRLTPEVSRGEQSLFTDATAPGVRLQLRDTREKWSRYFSANLAYFTGSGLKEDNLAAHSFIGKAEYVRPIGRFTVGAQFSTLQGTMANVSDKIFYFGGDGYRSNDGYQGKRSSMTYYSIGGTVGLNSCLGDTKIFGEYLFGNQLGTENSNTTPSKKFTATATTSLYDRDFSNYYLFLQHRIAQTSFTIIARYDFMNPNTKIKKEQIGVQNGTSEADVSYSTMGFGLHYRFLKYMSASAYYEIVGNEKCVNLPGYEKNRKDNLLTLRLQCAF